MTELLHWLAMLASIALIGGYIGRLKSMNVRVHRVDYVACHVIWLAYAGWVLSQALYDYPLDFELLPLVGAALWLRITHEAAPPRRRNGGAHKPAPAPHPIEDKHLRHVAGGRRGH